MHGYGAPQNIPAAIHWLQKATAEKDVHAYMQLATLYEDIMDPPDLKRALYWTQKAQSDFDVSFMPVVLQKLLKWRLTGAMEDLGFPKDLVEAKVLQKMLQVPRDYPPCMKFNVDRDLQSYSEHLRCYNPACSKKDTSLPLEKRSIKFMACRRCKKVQYCSKKCQKKDWNQRHKHECKRV